MKKILIIGAGALAVWFIWQRMPDENGESDQSATDAEDLINQAEEMINGEQVDEVTAQQNTAAFLAAITYGEGTRGDNGYRTLCGGGLFDSYADHPALTGWSGLPLSDAMCKGAGLGSGCKSTAAGRYQIIKPTWLSLKSKLGLPDFSPASQDAAAIELIRQRGALADVQAGRIESAVNKCAKVWASLPGAGYGQREVKLQNFISNYQAEGGALA